MTDASQRLVRERFLDDSEVNYLRYVLRLDGRETTIKRGLQLLCQHYERGRRLTDATDVRQLVHSHIGSAHLLVRRWALKALGLIGHPDDMPRIVDRLRVEEDLEAQTWGMAALLKNARDKGLTELCVAAHLEKSSAIVLASRLYAPSRWLKTQRDEIRISLDDDDLTLKWATFLIGYGRAPEELFHPRYKNEIFLGELNHHTSPDIREYSIWAMWERADYSAKHLKIPLHEARRHPESVRKWLYRLAAKSPDVVDLEPSVLSDWRLDASASAREGLALGVGELDAVRFGSVAVEWYSLESDEAVQHVLLESMAKQSAFSSDYGFLVLQKFREERRDSPLQRRLLAASVGTPLYGKLRANTAGDEASNQAGLFVDPKVQIIVQGDFVMGNQIKAGRDINANNLVGGSMIGSANAAVQKLSKKDEAAARVLGQIIEMLASTKAADEAKNEVAETVITMARTPTELAKTSLIDKLTDYGKKAAAVGGAIGGLDKLIEAVRGLAI